MTIANELQEKKKQLEFQIKLAMQKFMDETGCLIEEIYATEPTIGLSGKDTEEDIRNKKRKAILDGLIIKIKL